MKKLVVTLTTILFIMTSFCIEIFAAGPEEKGFYAYVGREDPRAGAVDDYVTSYDIPTNYTTDFIFVYSDGSTVNVVHLNDNGVNKGDTTGLSWTTTNDTERITPSIADKTYTFTYTDSNEDTYNFTLNTIAGQPQPQVGPVAAYDSNNELFTNIFGCEDGITVYLKPTSDNNIKNISINSIQYGFDTMKDYPNGLEGYSFDPSTGALTFNKIQRIGNYDIKVGYDVGDDSPNHECGLMIRNESKQPIVDGNTIGIPTGDGGELDKLAMPGSFKYFINDTQEKADAEENPYLYSNLFLFAGEIPSSIFVETPASEDFFASIKNVNVSVINSTFGEGDFTVTLDDDKINISNRLCYLFNVKRKAGASGYADIRVDFEINGDLYSTYYGYKVIGTVSHTINVSEDDMANFNNIFDSYEKVLNKYNDIPEDINDLTILLPEGPYSGRFKVDFKDYSAIDGFYSVNIKGSGDARAEGSKTTINGTLEVNGGYISVQNINFNADSSITTDLSNTLGITGTMAVVPIAKDTEQLITGVKWIDGCSFNEYDYAVVADTTGTVCDVLNSIFKDCGYGYYMDCQNQWLSIGGYSVSYNVFENSKNSAIYVKSASANNPIYSLRFDHNQFLNDFTGTTVNAKDISVGQEDSILHCEYNYYGKDAEPSNSSVRHVKVDYTTTKNTIVYTNPCMMFIDPTISGDPFILGIDILNEVLDGKPLYTCIFSGADINLRLNSEQGIGVIDVCGEDGSSILGSFDFNED